VNNAGINPVFGDLLDVDEKAWDKLFEVNLKAGFLMSKLFVPEIEKNG
jgi:dehydrogenase/reductase SDR family protein 4